MKIEKMDTYVVRTPPGHLGGSRFYFIKLTTDDGVEGWGETAILYSLEELYRGWPQMMEDCFAHFVKGKNPFDREFITKDMYLRVGSARPSYIAQGLISAFDIAMWDIAGKYCNQPIYNLLGGKIRDKVRSYTYIYPEKDCDPKMELFGQTKKYDIGIWLRAEDVADAAEHMVREGFTAIKMDPLTMWKVHGRPFPWELTLEDYHRADRTLGMIRDRVGPNVDIISGTHGQLNTAAAIRYAKLLEKYECMWFEEPTPPENLKEMAKVAAHTTVPLSGGERNTTLHEFFHAFEEGGFSIAQPDVCACGGITELKKIAAIAEPYYAQIAPHAWCGPVGHAAALQLDAVMPNFLIQESIYKAQGFFSELLDEPLEWKDGYLTIPDRPGLGRNLVESQLKKYSV